MATINRKTREYSDLDLLFQTNPFTKDVNRKLDFEAIKTSVRNLVLTKNYEKPFHPEIGTQVFAFMFDNYSPDVKLAAERSIRQTIERFEPRVKLISLEILENQDLNELTVEIVFTPANTDLPLTVTQTLGRIR